MLTPLPDTLVGGPAPPFRLPSAQGDEYDLAAFRGHRRVIIWFSKGFGCPFCRQQMTRFAHILPTIQAHDADLIQVTPTPLARARIYARHYALRFPYLCDPEDATRRAYGLTFVRNPLNYYAKKFVRGALRRGPWPESDYGATGFFGQPTRVNAPSPLELQRILADEDSGLFIVDRAGVVQYADVGRVRFDGGLGPLRPLPDNETILRELAACR